MENRRVAVVTGASRGIGRAIALELAGRGCDVLVNYAGNAEAAEDVVRQIQQMGCKALAFQADVSQAPQVEAMMKTAEKELGGLHILVNNAGITRDNLMLRMKEEEWVQVLDTNLKGAFLCSKAVLRPMMKERYGRIVNVTSVSGVMGNPGQANYSAAKAGLIGLTKSTAREVASRNITVNAVAPGFILTDMTRELGEQAAESLQVQIPLARLGEAKEVAKAVCFLASEDAAYITGQVLHVDGGMAM